MIFFDLFLHPVVQVYDHHLKVAITHARHVRSQRSFKLPLLKQSAMPASEHAQDPFDLRSEA